jgi:hypothetical protein
MKHFHKSLFKKFILRAMSFSLWAERRRDTDVADKLIHASVAVHYSSDGSVNLDASMRGKSSYLKILEVQD